MKKYLFGFAVTLAPFITLAHGMEDGMEEGGFGHQMEELSPLTHIQEGHWYSAILITVLWLGFIYAVYSLAKKCTKKETSGPTM